MDLLVDKVVCGVGDVTTKAEHPICANFHYQRFSYYSQRGAEQIFREIVSLMTV